MKTKLRDEDGATMGYAKYRLMKFMKHIAMEFTAAFPVQALFNLMIRSTGQGAA